MSSKRKFVETSDPILKRLRAETSIGKDAQDQDSKPLEMPDPEEEDSRFYGDGLSDHQRTILEIVDSGEEKPAIINLPTLKKMVLKFEKAMSKNQELRMKHPDDPMKFIDSEADLDDEINALAKISAAPNLYPQLVELGVVSSIMSLLSHENTDIAISAINLIRELTDEDIIGDEGDESDEDGMKALVKAFIDEQLLELLSQNLERFNEDSTESDDRTGVFGVLDVSLAETAVEKTSVLPWIVKRISKKGFDSNKQYASELLSILVQQSAKNRLALKKENGVATLLRAIWFYRKSDPEDPDEIEMMENFFDCLCLSLAESEVKTAFVDEEGLELMQLILRQRKMAYMRALKVVDHALTGKGAKACCTKFVEIGGLKTLFPILMKKGVKAYKKLYRSYSEREEEVQEDIE
ncbi:hypothetical protein HDU96_001946 [Phlyctochytrium bullatum]|nr:hypothetical protein HDU96_001946 [Phlyctochytrium bullatum]